MLEVFIIVGCAIACLIQAAMFWRNGYRAGVIADLAMGAALGLVAWFFWSVRS